MRTHQQPAIEALDIDPMFRKHEGSLDELSSEQLEEVLNFKGYYKNSSTLSDARVRQAIENIEAGMKIPSYIYPMSVSRYQSLDMYILLKRNGYRTYNIEKEELQAAYDLLMTGKKVPESNKAHPAYDAIEQNMKVIESTNEDLYKSAGFNNPGHMARSLSIYSDIVIKSMPLTKVMQKYKVRRDTVTKAIEAARRFRIEKFIPQEEVYDKIQEVRAHKQSLYAQLEKAKQRLNEFDDMTENSYYDFIQTRVIEKTGDEQIVISGIARERKGLQDSIIQLEKTLGEFAKSELELQGHIGNKLNVVQVNVNTEGKDKEDDKKLEDYVQYLEPEDQKEFNKLMTKLSELYYKDLDGSLNKGTGVITVEGTVVEDV